SGTARGAGAGRRCPRTARRPPAPAARRAPRRTAAAARRRRAAARRAPARRARSCPGARALPRGPPPGRRAAATPTATPACGACPQCPWTCGRASSQVLPFGSALFRGAGVLRREKPRRRPQPVPVEQVHPRAGGPLAGLPLFERVERLHRHGGRVAAGLAERPRAHHVHPRAALEVQRALGGRLLELVPLVLVGGG